MTKCSLCGSEHERGIVTYTITLDSGVIHKEYFSVYNSNFCPTCMVHTIPKPDPLTETEKEQ